MPSVFSHSAVVAGPVVERSHHVGVRNVGERAKFVLEAEQRGRLDVGHGLQGHRQRRFRVARAIHDPHPALTEPAFEHEAFGSAELYRRAVRRHSHLSPKT